MCYGSGLQSGSGDKRNTTSPRLYSSDSSQDTIMDETPSNESSPREAEREPRASDRLLFERLCRNRDRLYDRITGLRRALIVEHPELAESLSSLIRFSVRLGRIEQIVLCCDPDEDAPFESIDLDENDD